MNPLADEAGSAMLELALFLPLFVVMLVGIADYGFLIVTAINVQQAAAAGAAYGTIPGNYKDITGMQAAAKALSPMLANSVSASAVDIYSCSSGGSVVLSTAYCSGGGNPLMFAQVTTTYTANTVFQFVGFPATVTMQGFASYEVPWAP